jgi:hypothetical protein
MMPSVFLRISERHDARRSALPVLRSTTHSGGMLQERLVHERPNLSIAGDQRWWRNPARCTMTDEFTILAPT